MNKTMHIAVLAMSLVSLFAVMSSAAGAVTWTNTGQTTFTATVGAATLSSTGASLNCASGEGTGATRTPAAGVGAAIATGTVTFTTCRIGAANVVVHCFHTLTANTFAAGVTSGTADATCGMFIAGRENCHLEGGAASTYTNGAAGILSFPHSASLVVTNGSGGGSCALGSNDRVTLTPSAARVTSGTGPVIATD